MTTPIPDGFHSITPMFVFKDAQRAIDFYRRAFGAEVRYVMPGPDGKGVMHAELQIGDSILMLGEENPQTSCKSAETLGASPVSLYLYVDHVDTAFETATAAGATIREAPEDMFWGDRVGTVQDPFGHTWSLATHTRDLTPEQIRQGAEAAFAQMPRK